MKAQDHLMVGLITGTTFAIAFVAISLVTTGAEAPAPAPSALTAEGWTPCEPPRPDVECWRSGHDVVCLPLAPADEP